MNYYSQFNQDEFLDKNIFKSIKNGFFLEIGADDGIHNSNTYFFEKYKNWKGISIEPRKEAFKKLCKNRKCYKENVCITDTNEKMKFLEINGICAQYSGLIDKYDKQQIYRINTDIKKLDSSKKEITVNCLTLNNLMEKYNISEIDYCSIDTEGGELDILKNFNFSKYKIKVISIENNFEDKKIKKFLKSKGYKLIKKLVVDEIYILNNSGLPDYHEKFNLKQFNLNLKKSITKKLLKFTPRIIKNILKKIIN